MEPVWVLGQMVRNGSVRKVGTGRGTKIVAFRHISSFFLYTKTTFSIFSERTLKFDESCDEKLLKNEVCKSIMQTVGKKCDRGQENYM